jgi:hypothetical protein
MDRWRPLHFVKFTDVAANRTQDNYETLLATEMMTFVRIPQEVVNYYIK